MDGASTIASELRGNWSENLRKMREDSRRRVNQLAKRIRSYCDGLDQESKNSGRLYPSLAQRAASLFVSGAIDMCELDDIFRQMKLVHEQGRLYSAGRYFVVAVEQKSGVCLSKKQFSKIA